MSTSKTVPRLKETYRTRIVPELMKKFSYANPMMVPRLSKIVITMSVNDARDNIKALDAAAEDLAAITGQKPQVRRAKKAISNFKLRKGLPIALRVTLRSDRMYEFLDRLIFTALPKIRDFKGLSGRSFDGRGNYNLGLTEQYIFPETNVEKSEHVRGMNITFVTTAATDGEARELLANLGLPFAK